MKYSVIDISSSSLSMIVAVCDAEKAEIVFKERAPLSLVQYLEDGGLSARGTEKLICMLQGFKETAAELGAQRAYLIATAALRHVKNFDEVAAAVMEQTGFSVNLLDGETEAYCDYVANAYYQAFDRPVLIDLGGKSIEVCDLSGSGREGLLSLPFGLLDLYRKFISDIYPDEKEAKQIKRYAKEKFDRAGLPKQGTYATCVLVGATSAALYDIYAEFSGEGQASDVKTIRRKKFKKLVGHLLTGEDRSRLVLNNAPEKIYLIGSAAVVLKYLFKRFDAETILVSDRGVKEGYLQLVLEGRQTGGYYDFVAGRINEAPRPAPARSAPARSAPAKRRGRPKKNESAASAPARSAPAKRRGRPKKSENGAPMPATAPAERDGEDV